MNLIDVENMPLAELKAQKAELVKEASGFQSAELAARYVQARTDAKMRDEKLAEQGATITNLNAALAVSTKNLTNADSAITSLRQANALFESSNKEFIAKINELQVAVAKAESLARARRDALVDVLAFAMSLNAKVAPLLAAE